LITLKKNKQTKDKQISNRGAVLPSLYILDYSCSLFMI